MKIKKPHKTDFIKNTRVRVYYGSCVLALLRAKRNNQGSSAAADESSRTVLVASTHLFWVETVVDSHHDEQT